MEGGELNTRALRCVSVTVTPETEDATSELLARVYGATAAICTDLEAGISRAQVYVTITEGENGLRKLELRKGLKGLCSAGLDASSAVVRSQRLKPQDWAESWKRHFKPIAIAGRLLIKPSWSKRRPGRDARVVVLDPGLSFGTGQHPTTRFCLEQLVRTRSAVVQQSCLDIGTGTGILAISAAKLGYDPVEAFDFDPDAVRIAQQNAKLNKVGEIRPRCRDLVHMAAAGRKQFDVVCANLTHDLLVSERIKILNRLRPGGRLILAGILREQFPVVRAAYGSEGARCVAQKNEREWTSGVFEV